MVVGANFISPRIALPGLATAGLAAVAIQGLGVLLAPVFLAFWVMVVCYLVGGAGHGVKNVAFRSLIPRAHSRRIDMAVRLPPTTASATPRNSSPSSPAVFSWRHSEHEELFLAGGMSGLVCCLHTCETADCVRASGEPCGRPRPSSHRRPRCRSSLPASGGCVFRLSRAVGWWPRSLRVRVRRRPRRGAAQAERPAIGSGGATERVAGPGSRTGRSTQKRQPRRLSPG